MYVYIKNNISVGTEFYYTKRKHILQTILCVNVPLFQIVEYRLYVFGRPLLHYFKRSKKLLI